MHVQAQLTNNQGPSCLSLAAQQSAAQRAPQLLARREEEEEASGERARLGGGRQVWEEASDER
jgi:hypothetical protein